MKSKYALAAVLVLSIIALTGISTVFATEYPTTLEIYQKNNGVIVWTFPTAGMDWAFSGKDIDVLHCEYYVYSTQQTINLDAYISTVHYTTKSVTIYFQDLSILETFPRGTLDSTYVTGTAGLDTFIATGPGFTYIHH